MASEDRLRFALDRRHRVRSDVRVSRCRRARLDRNHAVTFLEARSRELDIGEASRGGERGQLVAIERPPLVIAGTEMLLRNEAKRFEQRLIRTRAPRSCDHPSTRD